MLESAPQEIADLSALPSNDAPEGVRQRIERLEQFILQAPQVDLQTRNYFAAGLYAREITIPAGTVLTGAVHKHEHMNICHGDITVWTDEGMRRITGHATLTSKPGMKRAGFAHADTVWTTIHATDETDIEKLEDMLVEESHRLQSRTLAIRAESLEALEG